MSRASDSIEGGCQDCDESGNPIESVSSPGDIERGEGWIDRDGGCICIYFCAYYCVLHVPPGRHLQQHANCSIVWNKRFQLTNAYTHAHTHTHTHTHTHHDNTQEFRMIQTNFESGPARTMAIDVKPRGPRGFSGSYTHMQYRHTNRHTNRHTDRHTDTQTHRQTHTHKQKQTERER